MRLCILNRKKKHCVPLFLFKLAQQFINLTLFFLVQLHQASDQPPPIVPRKSLSIAESVSLPNMYVKTPMKAQKAGLFVFTFRYLMLQWFWYLEQQWPKIRKLKYYVNLNLFFSFLPPKKKKQGDSLTQTMTMSQSRTHWTPPMKACSIRSRTLFIHVGTQLMRLHNEKCKRNQESTSQYGVLTAQICNSFQCI